MEETSSEKIIEQVAQYSVKFAALKNEIGKVIVGHSSIIDSTLIAMLSRGHVLLEGVPGVAKTTLIKTIADALGLSFSRIQFTPDLLPADLIGTLIYNPKLQEFDTKKGPLFANLILADEINRSPAKVQSALLEAMQERQVTIGSTTFPLEEPFLVFATQNPIENEGTYLLPEAQIDRFMFKLSVGYPTFEQEREILHRSCKPVQVNKVLSRQEIIEAQKIVHTIFIDARLIEYILKLVFATREPEKYGLAGFAKMIQYGASPRASIAIIHACKAYALLQNRHFVIPDDIKIVAKGILRHRTLLTYHAQAENITSDMIIDKIFEVVATP
ncbi:MoxR family ATPase [Candidatus Babeliales bacterium]|nr:MoxR family ATPase [Candidatus Babeliales bacterium]MBP9843372.1 MoxR family ATPase [Candidatus Babeliales bacterium]